MASAANAMAPSKWAEYLDTNLINYRHKNKIRDDLLLLFRVYRTLKPQMDTYAFRDGSHRSLLTIQGNIPVLYKTQTYNIPIVMWLMDTHPETPPICYVKPTLYMEIKPSQYININGQILLPYLDDWIPTSSDLVGLVQVMCAVFGENSPVFSKGVGYSPPGKMTDAPTRQASWPKRNQNPHENIQMEILQREVIELRSRLKETEVKLEEAQKMNQKSTSERDGQKSCFVCREPNEVEFQCRHKSCKRCSDLLDYCPVCKTRIEMINII